MIECGRVILKILSLHLRERTEENSEITWAGSRCHGLDLNPTPLEYKFRVYHFTSLLCRYVFSSPTVLNILLVHFSRRVRHQTSRLGVSLIRRCVIDIRRGFALKYSKFRSTTNERSIIQQQELFVDTIKYLFTNLNIKWIYSISGNSTELEYPPSVEKRLIYSVI